MKPTAERLKAEQMLAVAGLAAAIELHDVGIPGQNAAVADLAVSLGEVLEVDAEHLLVLARAALLHDLGNLGIPRSLLHKPKPLTPSEWLAVKKHPSLGLEILSRLGNMDEEKVLLLTHHERLDGSGYPFALIGDQISFLARILAVADSYQSLVSTRPYRPSLGSKAALASLRTDHGKRFDVRVVAALTSVLAARQSSTPVPSNRRLSLPNRRFLGVIERRLKRLAP